MDATEHLDEFRWPPTLRPIVQPQWAKPFTDFKPSASHYMTENGSYGSTAHRGGNTPLQAYHRATPNSRCRYLSVPLLHEAHPRGSFTTTRPTSSQSAWNKPQGTAAAQLDEMAEAQYQLRCQTAPASWVPRSESRGRGPISGFQEPVSGFYDTSNQRFHTQPSPGDLKQQRLNSFITSPLSTGSRLDSEPMRMALEHPASPLNSTRFLNVRDPDGSGRIIDVAPLGSEEPPLPAPLPPLPLLRQPRSGRFVGGSGPIRSNTDNTYWQTGIRTLTGGQYF